MYYTLITPSSHPITDYALTISTNNSQIQVLYTQRLAQFVYLLMY